MADDHELRQLRREILRFGAGVGRRYPPELRIRISAWASARRRDGEAWSAIAHALGIPVMTLTRWSTPTVAPTAAVLRPVEVVADEAHARSGTLTLVTTTGVRIEDVTVADAITILRALA